MEYGYPAKDHGSSDACRVTHAGLLQLKNDGDISKILHINASCDGFTIGRPNIRLMKHLQYIPLG